MGLEVGGLLGLIWLIIVIWAIIKVANSPAGGGAKILWILNPVVVPVDRLDHLVLPGAQGLADNHKKRG